ncbi:hypothetical protein E2C01_016592 [Portunus trituberculatus]|uniref:Uncharacterized protein n=1 Tax=Portunus trituberculatus TaxID=210409 RepID=A0A5B7DQ07_PORTR|nr:hypothetical protein [Portunus trituberculatus]
MAKCASGWSGLGGLGLMNVGVLPRWFAFSFSRKVFSVPFGDIDSSSMMGMKPNFCENNSRKK